MLNLWIILQIILESVPVSSSGHVALMQRYFGNDVICDEQLWMIDFLLHGPMIVILLIFFFKIWWEIIFHSPISVNVLWKRASWVSIIQVFIFGLIADGITVAVWYFDIMPKISLTSGFMITAFLLYATRYIKGGKNRFNATDYWYAICLGIAQIISFLPGVSRFGSTYVVGRFCGYSSRISFATSFFIEFPLLVVAFVKGIVTVRQYQQLMRNFFDFKIVFVILTASIISYVALCCVYCMIKKDRLWQFSWYMILPIILTLIV